MDTVYVYIAAMKRPDGRFCAPTKIGMSSHPAGRISNMQTGCPYPIGLVGAIKCGDRKGANGLESMAHHFVESYNVSGEWFDMDPYRLLGLIADLKSDLISDDIYFEENDLAGVLADIEESGINRARKLVAAENYIRAWETQERAD